MTIPNTPASVDLSKNIIKVHTNVKSYRTSLLKTINWNFRIPNGGTKLPSAAFKKLARAAQFFREGFYTNEDIKKIQEEGKKAQQAAKAAQDVANNSKRIADIAKKANDYTEKIYKALFAKVPGSDFLDAASRVGGILGILSAIGLVFFIKLQEEISNGIFSNLDAINKSASDALTTLNVVKNRVVLAEQKIKKVELDLDANAKDYYQLNKRQQSTETSIVETNKKVNDTLYETRQGRVIVEGKVAEVKKQSNDALYETRQTKVILDAKISEANKQNNNILYETREGRKIVEQKITDAQVNLDAKIQQINGEIARITSKTGDAINSTIAKLQAELAKLQASIIPVKPVIASQIDTASITANAVSAAKALVTPLQSQVGNLQTTVANVALQANAATALAATASIGVGNLASSVNRTQAVADNANNETQVTRTLVERVLVPRIEVERKYAEVTRSTTQDDIAALKDKIVEVQAGQEQTTYKIIGPIVNPLKLAQQQLAYDLAVIDKKYLGSTSSIDAYAKKTEQELARFKVDVDLSIKAASDPKLLEERFQQKTKDLDDAWTRQRQNQGTTFTNALKEIEEERTKAFAASTGNVQNLQNQISDIKVDVRTNESDVEQLNKKFQEQEKTTNALVIPKLDDFQKLIKTNEKDITKLDEKLKEQEKMNGLALPKLDNILGLLPLIPARAAAAIRPGIPTIPQIENATGRALCNSSCTTNALNNQTNNIKDAIKDNGNNFLNKINAGANAAQLALLTIINAKLGKQLIGGIGGKLTRFADWMHLDRVLNVMVLGATIHNALMLSNDIGQTFIGIINNVLQLVGLKKEDGQSFDIGSVISSSLENLIKGAIGAENYTNLTTAWAKANRIYQASVNILNAFQGLSSAILTGLEMTAGKVAKIGNALRKSGEVLESAYGWMNPQPKFNRVTQTLESLQNGASTIQMVTQAPLDIINATTELTTATTEFTNAIKEDDKPINKGKESPEPDKLKADELAAKISSTISNILPDDLFNGAE